MGSKFAKFERRDRTQEDLRPVRYGEQPRAPVAKTNWQHGKKSPEMRKLISFAERLGMFVREHQYTDRPSLYTITKFDRVPDVPRTHYREKISYQEALDFLESAP